MPRVRDEDKARQARQLELSGLTRQEIADRLGVTVRTLRRWLPKPTGRPRIADGEAMSERTRYRRQAEEREMRPDDHNALLDLEWLVKAGFDVTVSWRAGTWRVELPGPGGAMAMCGQGESPGEALAKAREWVQGTGASHG